MNNTYPPHHHETQQTRKEKRLRMQTRCKVLEVGEEESDQDPQQITTYRLQEAVEEMLRNVEEQNKNSGRKSVICNVC